MTSEEKQLISVIIPSYNSCLFIKNAVKSLLNQTYPNIEVIVVDDGSTDETETIIHNFVKLNSGTVRYKKMKHTGLLGVVRNEGIKAARGEYVAFLDSDDEWMPSKLEEQINILTKHPKIGLISSNALVRDYFGKKKTVLFHSPNILKTGVKTIRRLLSSNYIIVSSVIVRKSVLEQIGLFTDDPKLRAIEDYDLWLRMATKTNMYYLSKPLITYCDRSNSIRYEISTDQYWEGMLLILARLKKMIQDELYSKYLDKLIFHKEASYLYALSGSYFHEANYLKSLRTLIKYLHKRLL